MQTVVIDSDYLLFAPLRASWLEEPGPVAARLLAAADDPASLDGVTPLEVRVRAGRILLDHEMGEAGIAVLRQAVDDSQPAADHQARFELALALADAGQLAGAQEVALDRISALPAGGLHEVNTRLFLAEHFALGGHLELAEEWAGAASRAAAAGHGPQRAVAVGMANSRGARIRETVQVARSEGLEAARQIANADPLALVAAQAPPWPAVLDGRMVWWPEPQFARLVRQVPEVRGFLGSSWAEHTGLVEATARVTAAANPEPILLIAGFVEEFAPATARTNDPRQAATMTAYGALTLSDSVTRWPPPGRKPCWCGSGRRYRDCCGAPAAIA